MSADVCPVCGKGRSAAHPGFTCGEESGFSDCENARDLAIERAAEVERLNAEKAELLALCKRLSALPGDYNTIQDAEFVFRDINTTVSKFANTFCRDDRKTQPETK